MHACYMYVYAYTKKRKFRCLLWRHLSFLRKNKWINTEKKQICNYLWVMKWSLRILQYFFGVHCSLFIPTIHLFLLSACCLGKKKRFSGCPLQIMHPTLQTRSLDMKNGRHIRLLFFSTFNTVNVFSPIVSWFEKRSHFALECICQYSKK